MLTEIALQEGAREQSLDHGALEAMNIRKEYVFDDLLEARLEAAAFWGHRLNPVKICLEV